MCPGRGEGGAGGSLYAIYMCASDTCTYVVYYIYQVYTITGACHFFFPIAHRRGGGCWLPYPLVRPPVCLPVYRPSPAPLLYVSVPSVFISRIERVYKGYMTRVSVSQWVSHCNSCTCVRVVGCCLSCLLFVFVLKNKSACFRVCFCSFGVFVPMIRTFIRVVGKVSPFRLSSPPPHQQPPTCIYDTWYRFVVYTKPLKIPLPLDWLVSFRLFVLFVC